MPQKDLDRLETQTSDHNERIKSLELSFESVKPIVHELKEVAHELKELSLSMVQNTASNNETLKSVERVHKRLDTQESQIRTNTNLLAEAKPILKTAGGLHKFMLFFGFSMLAMSVSVFAYIAKTIN